MRLVLGQSGFGALRSWERDVALDIAAEALFNKLQSDREQPAIPPWAPPPSSPALTPPTHKISHVPVSDGGGCVYAEPERVQKVVDLGDASGGLQQVHVRKGQILRKV